MGAARLAEALQVSGLLRRFQ